MGPTASPCLIQASCRGIPLAPLTGDRRDVIEVPVVVENRRLQAQRHRADEQIYELAAAQATDGQITLHAKSGLHVPICDLDGPQRLQ